MDGESLIDNWEQIIAINSLSHNYSNIKWMSRLYWIDDWTQIDEGYFENVVWFKLYCLGWGHTTLLCIVIINIFQ